MPAITGAAMVGAAALGAGGSMWASSQSAAQSKDMYKKRYQWQVKDLKAAGLNPMLAYQNGAPVPNQPQVFNPGEGAAKGASTAAAIKSMFVQNKLTEEQTNLARTTATKERAIAEGQDIQNIINKSLPDYQNAVKALGPLGEAGPSAVAAERYNLGTEKMRSETAQAKAAAEEAAVNAKRAQNDYERETAMKPLVIAHQKYVNRGLKLGLSQKEADAQFYEMLGGWAKGSGLVAEAAKLYMIYLKTRQ